MGAKRSVLERLDPVISIAPLMVILGLLLALSTGWLNLRSTLKAMVLAALAIYVVVIVWDMLIGLRRHRRTARLVQNRFQICQSCSYLLVGLGESGRCPECGNQFNVKATEAVWRSQQVFPWRIERWWKWRFKRTLAERIGMAALMSHLLVLSVFVTAVLTSMLVSAGSFRGVFNLWGLGGLTIGTAFLATASLLFASRQIRARLWRNEGRLCPGCLAALPDGEGTVVCTACNVPVSPKELNRAWSAGYLRLPWQLVAIERTKFAVPRRIKIALLFFISSLVVLIICLGMGTLGLGGSGRVPSLNQFLARPMFILPIGFCLVSAIAIRAAVRHDERRLRRNDFLVCPRCLTLLGEAPSSECPKCELKYEADHLRALWQM